MRILFPFTICIRFFFFIIIKVLRVTHTRGFYIYDTARCCNVYTRIYKRFFVEFNDSRVCIIFFSLSFYSTLNDSLYIIAPSEFLIVSNFRACPLYFARVLFYCPPHKQHIYNIYIYTARANIIYVNAHSIYK